MKVAITGGSGFVGWHVALAVLAAGHECTILDLVDIPESLSSLGAKWCQGSLLSIDTMRQAFCGADAVLHLAAVGDVYLAAQNPALAAELNVLGSANVAEACLAEGVGRLIYASTWEVYGKPVYEPIDEHHPTNPDHPYNITKLAGEQLLLACNRLKGLPVVCLRMGTAYGSGMRTNSVFSMFIRRALRGEALTVSGDGRQHRQFTHASDIGHAFVAALESRLQHEVINVVAEESVSIRHLAELIIAQAPAPLIFGDPRPGDISPALVSAVKAHDLLGWSPRVSFSQGLAELIDHYRASLG